MKCTMSPARRKGHCHFCGKLLQGRQQKWCGIKCGYWWWANHGWNQARTHAKNKVWKKGLGWQCAHCKDYFHYVEVNHIKPVLGKHSRTGCWHHQDGLEVLCKPCHLAVTRQQRADGKLRSVKVDKRKRKR